MQLNELKIFIKQNAPWIYAFINSEVLKGVGEINPNYFVKLLADLFGKRRDFSMSEYNLNPNIFPYFIFTIIEQKGRLDYTSLRRETIHFAPINEEAKVYYNYARFSLQEDFFCIDLMQTKIGGMPIDEDIVKFTKRVPIQSLGLEEFIDKNADMASNEMFEKIKEETEKML
ncbi:MAG: hypothetical protein ACNI3C_08890 [Candidatus Marinarcus sp.]|uniref:hypothetical protein n=1 Tax=Candidatus Marinarcus sp. TaxID=3100987 RepID=UPI003B0055F6